MTAVPEAAQSAADWGALATAFGAAVSLAVGIATVRQKTRADQRAEWWRRAQWAIDHVISDRDEAAEAGLIALIHLVDSALASDDDVRLVRDLSENIAKQKP